MSKQKNNNIDYKADSKDSKKKEISGGKCVKEAKNYDECVKREEIEREEREEREERRERERERKRERERESDYNNKGSNSITTETCEINPNWEYVKGKNGCNESKLYSSKEPNQTKPVKKGSYIDRFGYTTGSFFSPLYEGRPWSYSSRSIPYIKHIPYCEKTYNLIKTKMYHLYEVKRNFKVFHCGAEPIPYYGTEGGAEQYFLKNDDVYSEYNDGKPITNIQDLLDNNYIEEINRNSDFFKVYPDFGVYKGGSKHRTQKPTHRKKISKRRKNKSKRKTKNTN